MHAHAERNEAPRVVIVGGFLTSPLLYRPFRGRLLARGATDVRICSLWTPEWLLAATGVGFGPLMRRAGTTIARAYREGDGQALLVVGHSAGGILARLAMSPQPFEGRLAAVGPAVGALVTLGTPHHLAESGRRVLRVGWRAQRFLEAGVRDGSGDPPVGYLTVSSDAVRGGGLGDRDVRQLVAGWSYRIQAGDKARRGVGDGLVPEAITHLDGARHICLPDARHGPMWGEAWYGEDAALDTWWPVALEVWRASLAARGDRSGPPKASSRAGLTAPGGSPVRPVG